MRIQILVTTMGTNLGKNSSHLPNLDYLDYLDFVDFCIFKYLVII